MRIATESQPPKERHQLPHQGLWFLLLLTTLLLLLSKDVTGRPMGGLDQCVIAYSSTLMPSA